MARGPTVASRRTREERDKLVLQFRDLVGFVVKRLWRGMAVLRSAGTFEDAIQAGSIGLIRAAELWDDTRNVKFITYAFYAIRNAVVNHATAAGLIRVPVAIALGKVKEHQYLAEAQAALHLKQLANETEQPDRRKEYADCAEEMAQVNEAMLKLPVRDRFVLRQRRQQTLTEVGQLLGVSKERVRQIEKVAKRRLLGVLGVT